MAWSDGPDVYTDSILTIPEDVKQINGSDTIKYIRIIKCKPLFTSAFILSVAFHNIHPHVSLGYFV
jgi:hypothetical protein